MSEVLQCILDLWLLVFDIKKWLDCLYFLMLLDEKISFQVVERKKIEKFLGCFGWEGIIIFVDGINCSLFMLKFSGNIFEIYRF